MTVAEIDAGTGFRSERATLRDALRRGDALTAARAWERLRVVAQSVSARERALGREARKSVGRAIRDARYRRLQSAMDALDQRAVAPATEAARARSRVRPLLAAVVGLALIALALVFVVTRPEEDYAPAAAAPAQVSEPTAVPTANTGGRGRTAETPVPVAIVTPVPADTPAPSAAPSASGPAGTPGATQAAGAQPGGVAGGVTGGVTGGTTGGVVGGVVGGTGTKTLPPATPTPYILPRTPPALPPGQDRFLFRVIDQATGAPLAGVCVSFGQFCRQEDPHTNVDGLYWLDLNPGNATAWNFRFFKDDYLTANLNKTYRPGMGISTTTVFLRHL
jgi:hypothetical protein